MDVSDQNVMLPRDQVLVSSTSAADRDWEYPIPVTIFVRLLCAEKTRALSQRALALTVAIRASKLGGVEYRKQSQLRLLGNLCCTGAFTGVYDIL